MHSRSGRKFAHGDYVFLGAGLACQIWSERSSRGGHNPYIVGISMTISMRRLLQAGVHFGHQTRYWSPSMAPYIFGRRNKIHIIDLEKTLPMLDEAMNYLGSVAAKGGKILFVGTKRQASRQIRQAAIDCDSPYVDHRWLGGMLTNFKTVKNSIARLKELEKFMESSQSAKLSKKEILSLDRERAKLDRNLSGIKDLERLPDALFVIDIQYEKIAVREAVKLGLPVIAVVDTNCTPKNIDYVIPGNDDSAKAIGLYLEAASTVVKEAYEARKLETPLAADEEFVDVEEVGKIIDLSGVIETDAQEQSTGASDAGDSEEESQPDEAAPKKVVRKQVVRRQLVNKQEKSADESSTDVAKESKSPKPSLDKVAEILKEVAAGRRSQAGAIRYMHEAGMDHRDIADRLEVGFKHVCKILLDSASILTRPVEFDDKPPASDDPFA